MNYELLTIFVYLKQCISVSCFCSDGGRKDDKNEYVTILFRGKA